MLLFLQNIRSLDANYDELMVTFEANQIMPRLLALTETWLKDYSIKCSATKIYKILLRATDLIKAADE